jgi:hypothetical protein
MTAQPDWLCPHCGNLLVAAAVRERLECPACHLTIVGCREGKPTTPVCPLCKELDHPHHRCVDTGMEGL